MHQTVDFLREKVQEHSVQAAEAERREDLVACMVQHMLTLVYDDVGRTLSKNLLQEADREQYLAKLHVLQDEVAKVMQQAQCRGDASAVAVDAFQPMRLDRASAVTFKDIVGFDREKNELRGAVINPILYPGLFPVLPRAVLLYGLPGTGKTFFVRALMYELAEQLQGKMHLQFYAPTAADLKGKYVGETEKRIAALFDMASKRATECCRNGLIKKSLAVIFLDELEALAGDRSLDASMATSVNMLLQKMDGVQSLGNILVIGASNFPWRLDAAILRRFTKQIYVTLPGVDAIVQMMTQEITRLLQSTPQDVLGCAGPAITAPVADTCASVDVRVKEEPNEMDFSVQKLIQTFVSKQAENLTKMATLCYTERYSNSDILRLVREAMYMSSQVALQKNVFQEEHGFYWAKPDSPANSLTYHLPISSQEHNLKIDQTLFKSINNLPTESDVGKWNRHRLPELCNLYVNGEAAYVAYGSPFESYTIWLRVLYESNEYTVKALYYGNQYKLHTISQNIVNMIKPNTFWKSLLSSSWITELTNRTSFRVNLEETNINNAATDIGVVETIATKLINLFPGTSWKIQGELSQSLISSQGLQFEMKLPESDHIHNNIISNVDKVKSLLLDANMLTAAKKQVRSSIRNKDRDDLERYFHNPATFQPSR